MKGGAKRKSTELAKTRDEKQESGFGRGLEKCMGDKASARARRGN